MNDLVAVPGRVLQAAALSDAGRVRANNEDLPLLDASRGIFGVIDGVGGHSAGELAASIARDVILQRLARPLGTPAERVREAIAIANNEIYKRASTSPGLAGMTCVLTLAIVGDGRLTVGHVGDSRLYKFGRDGYRKVTHDHSPVGEREDAEEISEQAAMRHPRRHEVFRDVGSALRDKDEDDYVEVVDEAFGDDEAILVCSDGLTDMVPSSEVDRLVRTHAGDPVALVSALVAAANEAGGRDNVTAVYAEGPAFAKAVRVAPDARPGRLTRVMSSMLASRALWFSVGAVLGVAGALLLAWRVLEEAPLGARTLAAAPVATEVVQALPDALSAARPGDVVRLEPGVYRETVVVPPGVSLEARVPGASRFERPDDAPADWIAITADGDMGGRLAGLRIVNDGVQAMRAGVRVSGQGWSLEMVQFEGAMTAAVEVEADASVSLRSNRVEVVGAVLKLVGAAHVEGTANLFVGPAGRAGGAATSSPLAVADDAQMDMRGNVFVGFGDALLDGLPAAVREPLVADNVVVSNVSPRR